MTKICSKCKQDLPLSAFYKHRVNKLQSYCKKCNALHSSDWSRKNAAFVKQRVRNRLVNRKFKLTSEQFDSLLLLQNGVCAICKRPEVRKDRLGTVRSLVVDHDHSCCPRTITCGKCIRGLLCDACNLGLGAFQDDPLRLQASVDYLNKWFLNTQCV
jgi:hypothetical protein